MTANPAHARTVDIAAGATWTAEVGAGFLVLVADMSRAGLGVTRIEIANSAVDGLERALLHPPGWEPTPVPEPHLLADGVRRDPAPSPRRDWDRVSETWFASGPWVLAWSPTLRDDGGGFARWEGWYLQGPGTPEFGVALGVGDEAPTRAAEAWIAANRRRPEAFPGERSALRMLEKLRETAAFDPTDPAGGDDDA